MPIASAAARQQPTNAPTPSTDLPVLALEDTIHILRCFRAMFVIYFDSNMRMAFSNLAVMIRSIASLVCLSFIITVIFYFVILATAALVCTDDHSKTIYSNLYYHGEYIAKDVDCEEFLYYFKAHP